MSEFDPVQKAEHYNLHPSGVECIDIVRHHDFSTGNAIKYLWRAGLKEPGDPDKEIQDLEKAAYYVRCRIEQLKDAKEVKRLRYEAIDSISDLGSDEEPFRRVDLRPYLDAVERAAKVDWQEWASRWHHDPGAPQRRTAWVAPEDWRHIGYVVGGESASFNEED